jgi:hypothetical protein
VGDDDDRVVRLQLGHELLDLEGRARVECGARLVHQDDLRLRRDRPCDAQPLLLAARQRQTALLELVLDLVPEGRPAEAALDQLGDVALVAVDPCAERDVVEDRLRKRVRLLEDHAHPPAELDGVDVGPVQVLAVEEDAALEPEGRDEVVHPVDRAQHGRLARARRADERGDLAPRDADRDVVDDPEASVPAGDALELEGDLALLDRHRGCRRGLEGGVDPDADRIGRSLRADAGLRGRFGHGRVHGALLYH